jgi:hypothetical protein
MTLPQTTLDQINSEAEKYGFVIPYDGSKKFYNEDKVKGYQAGATEWAGKAKLVIDALEQVESVVSWMDDGTFKKKLSEIIAKYKEVSNG